MKDTWYADNRDLVKWGSLLRLAEMRQAEVILQVAYYRPNHWPTIDIAGSTYALPECVTAHFRSIKNANAILHKTRNQSSRLVVAGPYAAS